MEKYESFITEEFEPGTTEKAVYNHLLKSIQFLERAADKTSMLKDGKRLKKILDKLGGELFDEAEFAMRGEYSGD